MFSVGLQIMVQKKAKNPKKVSTIWVKNFDPAVKRLNNIKSLMIGIKPKDAIKLDTVPLTKKDEQPTLSGVKICID